MSNTTSRRPSRRTGTPRETTNSTIGTSSITDKTAKAIKAPQASTAKALRTPKTTKANKTPKASKLLKTAKAAQAHNLFKLGKGNNVSTRSTSSSPRKEVSRGTRSAPQLSLPSFLVKINPKMHSAPSNSAVNSRLGTSGKEQRKRYQQEQLFRYGLRIVMALLAFLVLMIGGFLLIKNLPIFVIQHIQIEPSSHVSEEDINKLLNIESGTTLLNLDETSIKNQLSANPWVATVIIDRQFPDTLSLQIVERTPKALVLMSSGSIAWYMGEDSDWIEPTRIHNDDTTSSRDAAFALAREQGIILIDSVPATVDPKAATVATDEEIVELWKIYNGFSEDFRSRIVAFSAPSADAISLTLNNGVQVLVGSSANLEYKESIIAQELEKYADKLTYINVRIPTSPSIRYVDSDSVVAGEPQTN